MSLRAWIHTFCPDDVFPINTVISSLKQSDVTLSTWDTRYILDTRDQEGPGIIILDQVNAAICEFIHTICVRRSQRVLCVTAGSVSDRHAWQLLDAGASDVLCWPALTNPGTIVASRLKRWREVDSMVNSPLVGNNLIGRSQTWVSVLRRIVEAARFTDAPILLMGETGTGKELAARLIHTLDGQRKGHELVIVDCTTVVPELSGSELFGHVRGAFTGAVTTRDGAFALAHGGTLFLDEVGELPLGLQTQLLRVLQERTYKRVGSNTWQKSDFRLICATNRDLLQETTEGRFRRDLYYRLASWPIRLPSLRERIDDIIPLVEYFVRQAKPEGENPEIDDRVKTFFLTRKYPGNVRDLQNLVFSIMANYVGVGPITVGDIPIDERPMDTNRTANWNNHRTEQVVRQALAAGWKLRDIKQAIEETAIQIAVEDASGDLTHASVRLGVTVRTLQNRRAQYRRKAETVSTNGFSGC